MSASDLVGETVSSRYRIVGLLGEGGMGAVYEATHLKLGKRVVIKTLRGEHSGDPRFRARFVQEARATSSIEHANIVKVHDVGVHDERLPYYVMEYLEGEDLADTLLRERRLAWPRVRWIGLQMCAGLAAAHAKRIVHRDLKPSNCFRIAFGDDEDFIKILDFGLAKIVETANSQSHRIGKIDLGKLEPIDNDRWCLTETGQVFGTMAYMSPEHLFGERVDHRTDIYALGVILYELLTGRTPFVLDGDAGRYVHSLRCDPPLPPSHYAPDANIPPGLDQLILRALAKRPRDRWSSMAELRGALMGVRAGQGLRPLALPPRPSARPSVLDAVTLQLADIGARVRAFVGPGTPFGGLAAGLAVLGLVGASALALPSEPAAQVLAPKPAAPSFRAVAVAAAAPWLPGRLERQVQPAAVESIAAEATHAAIAGTLAVPVARVELHDATPTNEPLLRVDRCRIEAKDFAPIVPVLLQRAKVPRKHGWAIPVTVEIQGARLRATWQPATRGLRRHYSAALAELVEAHVEAQVEGCRRREITIFF